MAQAKWLKVGAAAFLSMGMLSACGGAEEEAPVDNNVDVTPEEGEDETENPAGEPNENDEDETDEEETDEEETDEEEADEEEADEEETGN